MSRPNPFVLAAGLLLFCAVFGGLPLLKGGLYLDTHEGDTYHLLDILLRTASGGTQHVDFSTPLGFLAILPISALIDAGFSTGMAFILAQLLMAGLMLPVVVYAASTRFETTFAWAFGLLTLLLVISLSFGGTSGGTSISMHYNRWVWALAFVAIALAVLPVQGPERMRLDCILIGVLGAVLALMKITYFVGLAPGVALAVALRWRLSGLVFVAIGGLTVALLATLIQGFGFWAAYLGDLRLVVGNEVRPSVGGSLDRIIAGAPFLGATLLGLAAFFLLRQREDSSAAFAFLLLVPGFIYVTRQNFGNELLWLWLVGFLMLALRPETGQVVAGRFDLRGLMQGVAIAAFAMTFPSLVSHATSTVRHASYAESRFLPIIPGFRGEQDIFIRNDRANSMTAQIHRDREVESWVRYADVVGRAPLHTYQGMTFPHCEWMAGSRAALERMAEDLAEAKLPPGSQLFTTDNLSALWLFGDFAPLQGGAPWYYGGLKGLENADYLVIPKCAFVSRVRGIILRHLKDAEREFTLVRENEILALYRVD